MWVVTIPSRKELLVELLFGPGQFVWPEDSETQLASESETLKQEDKFHEDQGMEVRRYADQVFSGGAWEGESAQAAEEAYRQAVSAKFEQSEIARAGSAPARASVERCRADQAANDRGKRRSAQGSRSVPAK